jgi:antirestriction protein
VANGIVEHSLAFAAWANLMEGDNEALATERFQDALLGHYDSTEAYVEQLVDDLGYGELLDQAVPEHLRPYVQIHIEGLARDMELSGDIYSVPAGDYGVWLFDAR